jgi:hypothetical protein
VGLWLKMALVKVSELDTSADTAAATFSFIGAFAAFMFGVAAFSSLLPPMLSRDRVLLTSRRGEAMTMGAIAGVVGERGEDPVGRGVWAREARSASEPRDALNPKARRGSARGLKRK